MPQPQPQPIHLIIFSSPLFPAHWSLFLPRPEAPTTGKRIHATGDAAMGFNVEFDRGYDVSAESRRYKVFELGDVLGDGEEVYFGGGEEKEGGKDGDGGGQQDGDREGKAEENDRESEQKEVNGIKVYDRLEEIAASVDAPGKSLRSVGGSGEGPKPRVEVKNCQTWLRDVVAELVKHEVLKPTALQIIENAPKN